MVLQTQAAREKFTKIAEETLGMLFQELHEIARRSWGRLRDIFPRHEFSRHEWQGLTVGLRLEAL
jgi:hypothetical protein